MKLRCLFGLHAWRVHQEGLDNSSGSFAFVIAWKQCTCCAKTKLIHILR